MWGRAMGRRSRAVKWGKGRGEGKGKEGEGRKSQELDGNSMMVKDPGFKKARE